jgi:hypothetical protein
MKLTLVVFGLGILMAGCAGSDQKQAMLGCEGSLNPKFSKPCVRDNIASRPALIDGNSLAPKCNASLNPKFPGSALCRR